MLCVFTKQCLSTDIPLNPSITWTSHAEACSLALLMRACHGLALDEWWPVIEVIPGCIFKSRFTNRSGRTITCSLS